MGIMSNLITIHELAKRVYPNNELFREKFAGYLMACKQIDAMEYCNNDTYNGKKLYFFKDANERYTAVYDNSIIVMMDDSLYHMLQLVDDFIGNIMFWKER